MFFRAALLFLTVSVIAVAQPTTTEFNIRGSLQQLGMSADGVFDFELGLFDQPTGGTELATDQLLDIQITDGRYAFPVDFGAGQFDGGPRWIEVRVRAGDSTGAFEFLQPRVPVRAVPYAQVALDLAGGWVDPDQVCDFGEYVAGFDVNGSIICALDADSGGTVTQIDTGAGLSGGPITASGTIAADLGQVQARIVDSCAPGSAIRSIGQSGTVTCETDSDSGGTVTQVDAGNGLLGGPITTTGQLSVDQTQVQTRVSGQCLGTEKLLSINQDGTVNCGIDADSGDVTSVTAGNGLAGGGSSGDLALSVAADELTVSAAGGTLRVVDGVFAGQPGRVAVVATAGGDYADPQAALGNAVTGDTWCPAPSELNPCLVLIAAGFYEIAPPLQFITGIHVRGMQRDAVVISGNAAPSGFNGLINLAPMAVLESVTIAKDQTGDAIFNPSSLGVVRDVVIKGTADGNGIRSQGPLDLSNLVIDLQGASLVGINILNDAAATIRDTDIKLAFGASAGLIYGILGGNLTVSDTRIEAAGESSSSGVNGVRFPASLSANGLVIDLEATGNSSNYLIGLDLGALTDPAAIENSSVTVKGPQSLAAVGNSSGGGITGTIEARASRFHSDLTQAANRADTMAVEANGGSWLFIDATIITSGGSENALAAIASVIRILGSDVLSENPITGAIVASNIPVPLLIQGCSVDSGSQPTVVNVAGSTEPIEVFASRLAGAAVSGDVNCREVIDENFNFFAGLACPWATQRSDVIQARSSANV